MAKTQQSLPVSKIGGMQPQKNDAKKRSASISSQKQKKLAILSLRLCMIILLLPIIILSGLMMVAYDMDFYEMEFEKNDVYDSIAPQQAKLATIDLFSYLQGSPTLTSGLFSQKEQDHLRDVKGLMQDAYLTYIIVTIMVLLLAVLLFHIDRKSISENLEKVLTHAGLAGIVLLMLSAVIYPFFDYFFTLFHMISFDNDLWLLPPDSMLITLFPQQFWIDISFRIILNSLTIVFFMFVIALLLRHLRIRKAQRL